MNYFLKLECSNGFEKAINVSQIIEMYAQGAGEKTCIQLTDGKFVQIEMKLDDVIEMLNDLVVE